MHTIQYVIHVLSLLGRGQNDGFATGCFLLFMELLCLTASDTFHASGSLSWLKTHLIPLEQRAGWVGSTECLEVMDKIGSACHC